MKRLVVIVGKVLLFILLFSLMYMYAMFQGGFVSWFLFFSCAPIGLYIIAISLYSARKWHVDWHISQHTAQAGDDIVITIHVGRTIPFPLYYCLCTVMLPESLNKLAINTKDYHGLANPNTNDVKRAKRKVIFPHFHRTFSTQFILSQVPRGSHPLEHVQFRIGDPLGFVHKTFTFSKAEHLLVYPSERPLQMWGSLQAAGEGFTQVRSRRETRSMAVTGIREYLPGDRLSRIDWKQTARRNELITKEFEREQSLQMLVMMNTNMNHGANSAMFEVLIAMTLGLVHALEKGHRNVVFESLGEKVTQIDLSKGVDHYDRLLHYLSKVEPSHTPASFDKQKRKQVSSVIFMVTTTIDTFVLETVRHHHLNRQSCLVLWIHADGQVTETEQQLSEGLRAMGIQVQEITEQDLKQGPIGVNLT